MVVVALLSSWCFLHGNAAFGQSCSHSGLQTVLRVLGEYSDVTGTCKSLELENGVVEYVDIEFDDIPSLQSFMV